MMSFITVFPVITPFHSCLSHHVFDQVNLWPAWVGFVITGNTVTRLIIPIRSRGKIT